MSQAIEQPAAPRLYRVFSLLAVLAGFIGNVTPLYGVLYWQWDTFQLLMLYWMETLIMAFWTLVRLSRLSSRERGELTVNGKPRPASQFALVGFFTLHSGAFISVHLLFLWLFFSHEWLKKVHAVGDFFYELMGANYVWVALVFLFIASAISFLIDSALRSQQPVAQAGKPVDAVGAIVGGLYARIVIMQIAIIFGAMISGMSGSLAPLVIVIVLKTLMDLGTSRGVPLNLELSSKGGKIKIET